MAFVVPVALAANRVQTDDLAQDDLSFVSLLLAGAGWLVFWGIRERWTRPSGSSQSRRSEHREPLELPDDSPVVAEALCGGGGITSAGVGVIVLDLARRGFVTIEEHGAGTGYTFRRAETPKGELRPYENAVYTRLFAGGEEATFDQLREWAAARRQQAGVFLDRVEKYVENELAASGYVQRPPREPVVANLGVAGLVGLVGLLALVSGAVAGLVAVASAAGQVAAGRILRRRALLGTGRAGEWRTVAAALSSYDTTVAAGAASDGEQVPEPDAAQWDRLLVYAAALGVHRPFVAAALRRHPGLATDTAVAAWFRSDSPGAGRLDGIERLVRRFGADLRSATRGPAPGPLPLAARGEG